ASDPSSIVHRQSSLIGELRAFLKQRLPDYMLPAVFVTLDALPLTPNGKLDRRGLPEPEYARTNLSARFAAPVTPTERALAEIWGEALGLEQIGLHDNFFALGGHSLAALRVIANIRDRLRVEPPLRRLFELPTIARLAQSIEQFDRAPQPNEARADD